MAKVGRIFFPLDVNWYDEWGHLVSTDACALWLTAACASKRMTSDGKLTIAQLRRIAPVALQQSQVAFANTLSELDATPEAPLTLDGQAIRIHGWEQWHDTAEDVRLMSHGGSYGNHRRWHTKKGQTPSPTCEFCKESLPESGGDIGNPNPQSRVEKSRVDLVPDKKSGTGKQDLVFEALVEVCEMDLKNLSRTERGRLNAATKELKALNVVPDDIRTRALTYTSKWPGADLTPQALTGNWSLLAETKPAIRGGYPHQPPRERT